MKKILMLAISLLTLAMLVTPVMAEPTNGQKVTATLVPGDMDSLGWDRRWRTDGDIRQTRGHSINYYPITLTIGDDDPYEDGTSSNLANDVLNLKTYWLISRDYAQFTFPSAVGGFEGNVWMKVHIFTGWYSLHCVLHGFGDFEGQTLMLSYAGPGEGSLWTGYCLKG